MTAAAPHSQLGCETVAKATVSQARTDGDRQW